MDIKQELREVIDLQKLRTMPTLDIEELCRDALAEIERLQRCMEQASAHIANQERYIRGLKAQINDRYDRFLAAALQGLLGRATAATLMDGNDSLVKRARHIASLCVQAQPGEDS